MMPEKILVRGKLKVKRTSNAHWMVGDTKFTVSVQANGWVVKGLKRFKAEGRMVEIWLSETNTLLSVRSLQGS